MKHHHGIFCLALVFLVAGTAFGEKPSGTNCVSFSGEPLEDLYVFTEKSNRIVLAAERIVEHSGLEPKRFDVQAATVGSAAAALCGGERKVFYSPSFFNSLRDDTEASWEELSVLAHEVGHHLQNHTLAGDPNRQALELEADRFAGFVLCKLGGTLRDAQSTLERFSRNPQPGYPPLAARIESVALGWSDALEKGYCPIEARNALPSETLTQLEGHLLINAENAHQWAGKSILMARWIHFEKVRFEPQQPTTLLAERITFDTTSSIHGQALHLIAREIEGGIISADGGLGESGGEILVAAWSVSGTSLTARGGDGRQGKVGPNGQPGADGGNGRSGKCGPGMLGKFRSSKPGKPGGHGTAGGNGEAGGDGGEGGRILLRTFRQNALLADVQGGNGGLGGRGGKGGRGGVGGNGGRGCSGAGGSQPTRSDGRDGNPGADGLDGASGERGAPGRVWRKPLRDLAELRELVEEADTTSANLDALVATLKQQTFQE